MWVSRNNSRRVAVWGDAEKSQDVNYSHYTEIWKEQPRLNKLGRWDGRGMLVAVCATGLKRRLGLTIKQGQCFKLTGSFSNPKLGQRVYS